MIKNTTPLSLAEAKEYIHSTEGENSKIKEFINNFSKLDSSKAKELRKKLEELDLLKLKSENISKLIDLLPKDKTELNKIFIDVNLEEDETNKIINTIKEFL